jgi:hypothetical protein
VRQLYHFSEDPSITLFRPRVVPKSIEQEPLVWTIDRDHSPSYWFPRDCPRACCWIGEKPIRHPLHDLPGMGGTKRLHAIEAGWLDRMRACRLYAYEFDSVGFEMRIAEAGYWVTRDPVSPVSVTPLGDLISRHAEAGIELRIVPNLRPLIDTLVASGLEFSIIRKANAQPRGMECNHHD